MHKYRLSSSPNFVIYFLRPCNMAFTVSSFIGELKKKEESSQTAEAFSLILFTARGFSSRASRNLNVRVTPSFSILTNLPKCPRGFSSRESITRIFIFTVRDAFIFEFDKSTHKCPSAGNAEEATVTLQSQIKSN